MSSILERMAARRAELGVRGAEMKARGMSQLGEGIARGVDRLQQIGAQKEQMRESSRRFDAQQEMAGKQFDAQQTRVEASEKRFSRQLDLEAEQMRQRERAAEVRAEYERRQMELEAVREQRNMREQEERITALQLKNTHTQELQGGVQGRIALLNQVLPLQMQMEQLRMMREQQPKPQEDPLRKAVLSAQQFGRPFLSVDAQGNQVAMYVNEGGETVMTRDPVQIALARRDKPAGEKAAPAEKRIDVKRELEEIQQLVDDGLLPEEAAQERKVDLVRRWKGQQQQIGSVSLPDALREGDGGNPLQGVRSMLESAKNGGGPTAEQMRQMEDLARKLGLGR